MAVTPAKTINEQTELTATPASEDEFLLQLASGGAYRKIEFDNLVQDMVRKAVAATITAQHSFSPGSAQAPFVLGANAQGQLVTGLNADKLDGLHAAQLRRLVFSAVASSSAIASTTSETFFSNGPIVIGADVPTAGAVVRMIAGGQYSTNGTPTITMQAKYGASGGGSAVQNANIVLPSSVTNNAWSCLIEGIYRDTGSSAVLQRGRGYWDFEGVSTIYGSSASGTIGYNSTIERYFNLSAQWSASHASNSIVCDFFCGWIEPLYAAS